MILFVSFYYIQSGGKTGIGNITYRNCVGIKSERSIADLQCDIMTRFGFMNVEIINWKYFGEEDE